MIRLELNIDPVPKGRHRVSCVNGRAVTYSDEKTKKFETAVAIMAMSQIKIHGKDTIEDPVAVSCIFNIAIPYSWPKWKREAALSGKIKHTSKPDVDNLLKAIKDALNGIAWNDDAQVTSVTASKRYAQEGSISVVISEVSGFCQRKVVKSDVC